jgi:hypothetical protein
MAHVLLDFMNSSYFRAASYKLRDAFSTQPQISDGGQSAVRGGGGRLPHQICINIEALDLTDNLRMPTDPCSQCIVLPFILKLLKVRDENFV